MLPNIANEREDVALEFVVGCHEGDELGGAGRDPAVEPGFDGARAGLGGLCDPLCGASPLECGADAGTDLVGGSAQKAMFVRNLERGAHDSCPP